MSDNDPFALDMFGSSQNALLSGLGLGVTAFSESPKAEPGEIEPAPVANSSGSRPRETSADEHVGEAHEAHRVCTHHQRLHSGAQRANRARWLPLRKWHKERICATAVHTVVPRLVCRCPQL